MSYPSGIICLGKWKWELEIAIPESRISGSLTFFNLETLIFTMPQYREFEIVIFTENYDYLIHLALLIVSLGMAVMASVL